MSVTGQHGMITTPHPAATASGAEVLNEGGTAIDAMIAASATLAAVYPHMTGIGGDALWLLYDSKVRMIMGYGQSGQAQPHGGITGRGPGSVATTAAAIASWQTARAISAGQWGSSMPLPRLFEDGIHWARNGAPVSASQAFWIQQRGELLHALPHIEHIVQHPDGTALTAGDNMTQPKLANTLEHLARVGLKDFYHGALAREFAEGFAKLECGLTLADLHNTRAPEVKPLKVRYRAGDFYNFPPPSQGLYTLQAMATLNQYPLHKVPNQSAAYYHRLVEAIKHGLLTRNKELRDPNRDQWPYESSLTATELDLARAAPWAEPGQPADTIWMAATDREGRTACLMQSLFHDFGSGCTVGDTGVVWHNRAAGFNPDPHHPNAWAPGVRPAHTLNPSCYLADDGKRVFLGSQGGDGQPQTQLVLATQLIDYQQSVDAALAAPRFLLGRSFFDSTDNLKLEAAIAAGVQHTLSEMGHSVEEIPALSPLTGQAGVMIVTPEGQLEAMHDPRGEGNAIGL